METTTKSQIEVSPRINELAARITGDGLEFLENAKKATLQSVDKRSYNKDTQAHEASIRWRRTADQILQDGWVYQGKSCTDLVIVFIALCQAKGYETRFDKMTRKEIDKQIVHSVAEVKLEDDWYTVDIAGNGGIIKGEVLPDKEFNGYFLWKKGRDAWDLGLTNFESMGTIT